MTPGRYKRERYETNACSHTINNYMYAYARRILFLPYARHSTTNRDFWDGMSHGGQIRKIGVRCVGRPGFSMVVNLRANSIL